MVTFEVPSFNKVNDLAKLLIASSYSKSFEYSSLFKKLNLLNELIILDF